MRKARHYVYRNLHTKTFSLKYKGKVIAHPTEVILADVKFSVSEKGRQRVLKEKRKNVHATVNGHLVRGLCYRVVGEVYYNPYKVENFTLNGKALLKSDYVLCLDDKIFVIEEVVL